MLRSSYSLTFSLSLKEIKPVCSGFKGLIKTTHAVFHNPFSDLSLSPHAGFQQSPAGVWRNVWSRWGEGFVCVTRRLTTRRPPAHRPPQEPHTWRAASWTPWRKPWRPTFQRPSWKKWNAFYSESKPSELVGQQSVSACLRACMCVSDTARSQC